MPMAAASPSASAAHPVSGSSRIQEDTVTISDEAIALLHGNKHKKKDDILLLAYPHLQIYGGSQGLTAQATPGGQAVSGVGAAGGGAAAAGGAGGGK
jgi:hypothetical protein